MSGWIVFETVRVVIGRIDDRSPEINSGEGFEPRLLARDGNKITLLADSWTDNAGRDKNVTARQGYVLLLGSLEAGNYEMRLVWRGLFQDAARREPHYAFNSLRFGTSKFTVYQEDDKQDRPGVLAERDLQNVAVPEAQKTRRWQVPRHVSRSLNWDGNLNGLPAPGLLVGSLDLNAWLMTNPKTIRDRPPLGRIEAGSAVHASVFWPSLNSGERMTLREVGWQGKDAILRVDVWRDDGPRRKNIVHAPLLIVPLGKAVAGECMVRIDWSFLRAPNFMGVYKPEDAPKGIDEKSRQSFTVR